MHVTKAEMKPYTAKLTWQTTLMFTKVIENSAWAFQLYKFYISLHYIFLFNRRKSKWDVPSTENENTSNANLSATDAAKERAAKLNAMLAAQGKLAKGTPPPAVVRFLFKFYNCVVGCLVHVCCTCKNTLIHVHVKSQYDIFPLLMVLLVPKR